MGQWSVIGYLPVCELKIQKFKFSLHKQDFDGECCKKYLLLDLQNEIWLDALVAIPYLLINWQGWWGCTRAAIFPVILNHANIKGRAWKMFSMNPLCSDISNDLLYYPFEPRRDTKGSDCLALSEDLIFSIESNREYFAAPLHLWTVSSAAAQKLPVIQM